MIPNIPDRIFLSGFMGAGKSTLGRKLADELELPFIDLDDKIEEQAGQSIPQIFEESGEEGFRTVERRVVLDIIRNEEGIIALGGGSLQNQHLLDRIKFNGLLIFIEAPISVILERISGDLNRPLLVDEDGNPKSKDMLRQELQALYDERLPLYEQAVVQITDDGIKSPETLVENLLKKIINHVEYH